MKKILLFLLFILLLVGFSSANNITMLHGIATGDNVEMNFDDATYSTVGIDIDSYNGNICGTNYSGFLLTGYVNREGNGYVYFSEDDGDNTVNSCVAVILSGTEFYLTGTAATDSGIGYKMFFKNIKLNYEASKKIFYFDGKSVDTALGTVPNWNEAYVTGLNLIDWNKTVVDYSSLTGNYIANGTPGFVNVFLKDVAGNPVVIFNTIDLTLEDTSLNINGYTFLDKNGGKKLTLNVDGTTGLVKIPVYILKAASSANIKLKFTYPIIDMDGEIEHSINLTNLKFDKPEFNLSIKNVDTPIIGELSKINVNHYFTNTGNISSVFYDGNFETSYDYSSNITKITEDYFNLKIKPNNVDNTYSTITGDLVVDKYNVIFNDFGGKDIEYNLNKRFSLKYYADKRIDFDKSFSGLVLTNMYTGGNIDNGIAFTPILRDTHGYKIPDLKIDIKLQDLGLENTYSSFDCDEISVGYQTNCNSLIAKFDGTNFKGSQNLIINYKANGNVYNEIKITSYKPVSGANLQLSYSNIQNINSDWNNLSNKNDWIKNTSRKGNIENINFSPYFIFNLKGIDEGVNYVDINNSLYLELKNISDFSINSNLNLSGVVTKPVNGVTFNTGGKIQDSISLSANNNKLLSKEILFDIPFTYTDAIVFNYDGNYTLSSSIAGDMKLKPWYIWFDLGSEYKLGGVYVDGLVSKAKKISTSVKNYISRNFNQKLNFSLIYNRLYKKAFSLSRGLKVKTQLDIDINTLNGGTSYYKCDGNAVNINGGTYKGNNLLVLEDCKVFIKGNILKGNKKSSLSLFTYDKYYHNIDNKNYLNSSSNIYIAENVSDIEAALITKGSILTIDGNSLSDLVNFNGNIYMKNRVYKINNKQLYIYGTVISKNNIGGSFLTNNKMTVGISKEINVTRGINLWGINNTVDLRNISQIFDLNFARGFKFNGPNSIDPNWYSVYCNSHKSEGGCRYPVYIKYDTSIKQNVLFR